MESQYFVAGEDLTSGQKVQIAQDGKIYRCDENQKDRISPNSRLVALLLAFFFGCLGLHRFYVGKIGTGLLMLITFGFFGIWTIIDFIMILAGDFEDKNCLKLKKW
jgi:hypothetical protein